jgi:hypothetical protein
MMQGGGIGIEIKNEGTASEIANQEKYRKRSFLEHQKSVCASNDTDRSERGLHV